MTDSIQQNTGQKMVPPPRRIMPQSELDLNMLITDTVWGSGFIAPELYDKLSKDFALTDDKGNIITDDKGNPMLSKQSLWSALSFFTRDVRLGNLKDDELFYVRYYLDLANDSLSENYFQTFIMSLSRAACVLETSQSRGGFLRKNMNTLRSEQTQEILEPAKKNFFGMGKKQ